jgi:hypothetical protein
MPNLVFLGVAADIVALASKPANLEGSEEKLAKPSKPERNQKTRCK